MKVSLRICPGLLFVVEGNVTDLARDRIDELSSQEIVEPTRKEQELVSFLPDLWLVLSHPVRLALL